MKIANVVDLSVIFYPMFGPMLHRDNLANCCDRFFNERTTPHPLAFLRQMPMISNGRLRPTWDGLKAKTTYLARRISKMYFTTWHYVGSRPTRSGTQSHSNSELLLKLLCAFPGWWSVVTKHLFFILLQAWLRWTSQNNCLKSYQF